MDIETPFFLLVLERKSPKLKDHFTPVSITHPPEKCFPQMLAKYRSTTKWKLIFHDWMHLAGWAYLRRDFECHRTRRWLEKLTNPSLLAPKYTCLSKIDSNTPVVRLSSTHWEGQTAVAQLCCTLLHASPPSSAREFKQEIDGPTSRHRKWLLPALSIWTWLRSRRGDNL